MRAVGGLVVAESGAVLAEIVVVDVGRIAIVGDEKIHLAVAVHVGEGDVDRVVGVLGDHLLRHVGEVVRRVEVEAVVLGRTGVIAGVDVEVAVAVEVGGDAAARGPEVAVVGNPKLPLLRVAGQLAAGVLGDVDLVLAGESARVAVVDDVDVGPAVLVVVADEGVAGDVLHRELGEERLSALLDEDAVLVEVDLVLPRAEVRGADGDDDVEIAVEIEIAELDLLLVRRALGLVRDHALRRLVHEAEGSRQPIGDGDARDERDRGGDHQS